VGSPFPDQPYASKVPLEAVEALGKFVSSTPSLVRWGQTGLVVIRVGLKDSPWYPQIHGKFMKIQWFLITVPTKIATNWAAPSARIHP